MDHQLYDREKFSKSASGSWLLLSETSNGNECDLEQECLLDDMTPQAYHLGFIPTDPDEYGLGLTAANSDTTKAQCSDLVGVGSQFLPNTASHPGNTFSLGQNFMQQWQMEFELYRKSSRAVAKLQQLRDSDRAFKQTAKPPPRSSNKRNKTNSTVRSTKHVEFYSYFSGFSHKK